MMHVDGCCLQGSYTCLMWLHGDIQVALLSHQKVSPPKMLKYFCLACGPGGISFNSSKVIHCDVYTK